SAPPRERESPMADLLTSLDAILAPTRAALLVVDLQNDFIHPRGWSARHHPEAPSLRAVLPPIHPLHAPPRAPGLPGGYLLVEHGVGAGVVPSLCVQTTVQHAFALGYYVVVAEDGTAATDATVQSVTLANFRQFFGPVVPSETIARHWRPSPPARA